MVLVLKRLRRRGNGLKSHPTDWEKPQFTIPLFVAVFLGCTSTDRVGLCFLWFFVQELPKAQPAVVLVLKRLRRRQRLKVSSDRLGEAVNRTCDPWFTRHRFIPYTMAASHTAAATLKAFNRQMVYYIIYNFDFSNIYELTEILISLKIFFI